MVKALTHVKNEEGALGACFSSCVAGTPHRGDLTRNVHKYIEAQ